MLEHNENGAFGLVINHEMNLTFRELARSQELAVSESHAREHLHSGGPAEKFRGFVLHDSEEASESVEIFPGLFLTVATSAVKPLLLDHKTRLKCCLGCAGWGPGQLEKEFQAGIWVHAEADADLVQDFVLSEKSSGMWKKMMRHMGIDPVLIVPSGGLN